MYYECEICDAYLLTFELDFVQFFLFFVKVIPLESLDVGFLFDLLSSVVDQLD